MALLQGLESDETRIQTVNADIVSSSGTNIKTCVECGTSKTPLWRGGPAGPKVELLSESFLFLVCLELIVS